MCDAELMRPTLHEYAGGDAAFLRLAQAHHARCLADPELNHPFSHPGQHPQHVGRLAAYWAEVLGGPPSYSRSCGDQSTLLGMHAGNGDMSDLGRRFAECFAAAADDAGLPADPEFRAALRAYMEWADRGPNCKRSLTRNCSCSGPPESGMTGWCLSGCRGRRGGTGWRRDAGWMGGDCRGGQRLRNPATA